MKNALKYVRRLLTNQVHMDERWEALALIQGKQLTMNLKQSDALGTIRDIQDAEFKIFSQFGDDGIIQYLIHKIPVRKKTFVEFGVENYKEANTRFLLLNNNWSGLVLDGSEKNIAVIRDDCIYWKHNLKAERVFVTRENINSIIENAGFSGEIGLLHIDIDGNDYWVWKELNVVQPEIVIMEYNSVFGPERPITVPYDKDFQRTKAHHSNLFFGCSLQSLCDLGREKGYSFIGCNSHGNNAYFVRNSSLGPLKAKSPEEGYVLSQFRESRDKNGECTYLGGLDRIQAIRGIDVFNTRTKTNEKL